MDFSPHNFCLALGTNVEVRVDARALHFNQDGRKRRCVRVRNCASIEAIPASGQAENPCKIQRIGQYVDQLFQRQPFSSLAAEQTFGCQSSMSASSFPWTSVGGRTSLF